VRLQLPTDVFPKGMRLDARCNKKKGQSKVHIRNKEVFGDGSIALDMKRIRI
jgi:hypothetical protein